MSLFRKVVISGSSGFLGRALIQSLRQSNPQTEILGIDIQAPANQPDAPDRFLEMDIRDRSLVRMVSRFRPNVFFHLAFVFHPTRSESRSHKINVGGFCNALEAMNTSPDCRLVVCSSATVYGATPDFKHPHKESSRTNVNNPMRYAADKVTTEKLLKRYRAIFPDRITHVVRPALVGGRSASNYILRYLINMPFLVLIDGNDIPVQFVHVDDLCRAMIAVAQKDKSATFNVAPEDSISLSNMAERMNKPTRAVPYNLVRVFTSLAWASRIKMFETDPTVLAYSRFPWLIDSTKLIDEFDFRFEYSTAETFEMSLPPFFAKQRSKQSD